MLNFQFFNVLYDKNLIFLVSISQPTRLILFVAVARCKRHRRTTLLFTIKQDVLWIVGVILQQLRF